LLIAHCNAYAACLDLPLQIARTVVFAGADPGLSKKKFLLRWQGTGKLEFGNVQVRTPVAPV
jgi:hypothetical protein